MTFWQKTIFSDFNFWTSLFSKILPNFWWTDIHCIQKIKWIPLRTLIFGKKILLFRTYHLWNSTSELILFKEGSLNLIRSSKQKLGDGDFAQFVKTGTKLKIPNTEINQLLLWLWNYCSNCRKIVRFGGTQIWSFEF